MCDNHSPKCKAKIARLALLAQQTERRGGMPVKFTFDNIHMSARADHLITCQLETYLVKARKNLPKQG